MADRSGSNSWWRRASAIVGSAAWLAAVAGGCSSTPAAAAAYLTTFVQYDPGSASQCNFSASTPQFTLAGTGPGMNGLPNPPISDGQADGPNSASVSCTVSPSGSGFTVNANLLLGQAGNFALEGGSTPWPTKATTVTGVTISFGYNGVSYGSPSGGCSVTYNTGNTSEPIAPGRVWGSFTCPGMTEGMGTPYVCLGTGTFQLTNCAE
jgi:hypothetical protein